MITSHKKNIFESLGRNPVHPFPARMSPGIALEALNKAGPRLRVLDPMMGSGTVLAVARSLGHRASGVDLDPLAVLISRVWTRAIDPVAVTKRGAIVLDRARRRFENLSTGMAYPQNASGETREFIRYWFDDYARRQLTALAHAVSRVRDVSEREALWCAFSRLIITKQSGASLAMDLSHSRPHKVFRRAPTKPFNKFLEAVRVVVANAPLKGRSGTGPATRTIRGDARSLPVKAGSIDLVLTSPPYLNAIDYMRCSKFSLVWMGFTTAHIRDIRTKSIGTEVSLPSDQFSEEIDGVIRDLNLTPALGRRYSAILKRYALDMHCAVKEVARVLVPGGRAVYVVGNSTIRGTFIRNSAIVESVARLNGLTLVEKKVRLLPPNRRYLPPPSSKHAGASLSTRMSEEVVLAFENRKPTLETVKTSQRQ